MSVTGQNSGEVRKFDGASTSNALVAEPVPAAVGQESKLHQIVDFLGVMLPRDGWRCCWTKADNKNHFYPTDDALAAAILRFSEAGYDVYYNASSLKKRGLRTQQNVAQLKTFRLDCDVGEGKFTSQYVAARTVAELFLSIGLIVTFVNSGYGVHAYIVMDEPLTKDQWQPLAENLKRWIAERGLVGMVDQTTTADAARILRVPGTMNYRNPADPKPVLAPKLPAINSTARVVAALRTLGGSPLAGTPTGPGPAQAAPRNKGDHDPVLGDLRPLFPPSDVAMVANACAQVGQMREDKQAKSGLWYPLLGVLAYCDGGDEAAKEWSSAYPGATTEQTAEKLERQRQQTTGPTTCAHLESLNKAGCEGCPHKGRIKTPVQLGRTTGVVSAVSAESAGSADVPDMSMTELSRRPAPTFPINLLEPHWEGFIKDAANSAACPPDYVAGALLAVSSALIGSSRSARCRGWTEPPNLWIGEVGESGSSKTPGAMTILGRPVAELERRMQEGFSDKLRAWKVTAASAEAADLVWKSDLKKAEKAGKDHPVKPLLEVPEEPQMPRLALNDATVEKVATLMASAAPKGVLYYRDELAGWIIGMADYRESARQFWLESWNGKRYVVDRVKHPVPIVIPHLTAAILGGIQPSRLAELFASSPDDGLAARFLWVWPDPVPFRLGEAMLDAASAISALDRLRQLELAPATGIEREERHPVFIPVCDVAERVLERFAQQMQVDQASVGGLLQSAYGKARGQALRLSLIIEYLRWCMAPGHEPPPVVISLDAMKAACQLMTDYFVPMAARTYGDAALPVPERNAATLARWILKEKPGEVHVRRLQREVRLPGLREAHEIKAACELLVDANWLRPPPKGDQNGRGKTAYGINPRVLSGG